MNGTTSNADYLTRLAAQRRREMGIVMTKSDLEQQIVALNRENERLRELIRTTRDQLNAKLLTRLERAEARVGELAKLKSNELTREQVWAYLDEVNTSCGCEACYKAVQMKHLGYNVRDRMILCPVCSNKRCPHATHHDNLCTGSNSPGQVGNPMSVPKQPLPATISPQADSEGERDRGAAETRRVAFGKEAP